MYKINIAEKQLPFIFVTFICFGLCSCASRINNEELATHRWKYGGGAYYGDLIFFNEESAADTTQAFWLSGDTLFKNGASVALILDAAKKIDGRSKLSLKDIETGEESTYHDI